ncbi:MAG: 50S ribosomal protein L13 [Halorientalis sp.]
MSLAEFDADVVIDARDCVLGRVASDVAERALDGERVAVVNAEEAVITGRKEDVFATYKKRTEIGSDRGPTYPKRPDRIFKRSIRGMVPHKQARGREALERVRVYVGNPLEEDGQILEDTSIDRLSSTRFVTLGEVATHLGANVTW